MSRRLALLLLIGSAVASAAAWWETALHATVRETVGTAQWWVVSVAAGAALASVIAVGAIVKATKDRIRWDYNVYSPPLLIAAWAAPLAAFAGVGFLLMASVPAAKLKLLVADLNNRNPPLLDKASRFADLLANNVATHDLGFLAGLSGAGTNLHDDGQVVIDTANSIYGYAALADPAATAKGCDPMIRRMTVKDGEKRRSLILISGNGKDFVARQRIANGLPSQREKLRELSASHGAVAYLRDFADRFDDIASRVQIQKPTPEKIEALMDFVSALKRRSDLDLIESNLQEHRNAWMHFVEGILPAINAVTEPEHCGFITEAIKNGKELLGTHANQAKKATPPWWQKWKERVKEYPGWLPKSTPPLASLEKLGTNGRGQRDDLERELTAFLSYIAEVLKPEFDAKDVPPPPQTTHGEAPGSWTPAGVEAIVRERFGLQKWNGQKYPNGQEVLTVIQSAWAELWLRVTPRNTPMLDDAVRAAQAEAMKKLKLFLRQYGDQLRAKIKKVKDENYRQPGQFREPFRNTEPFNDENRRKQLRAWLIDLKYDCPTVETDVPQGPSHDATLIKCTQDACNMAEAATACFDRVASDSSKMGDTDWRDAGLWWAIFFSSPGDKDGFNPFDEASKNRNPATVKGADGKDVSIGGLPATDEASLETYGQPKPASQTPSTPTNDKPIAK